MNNLLKSTMITGLFVLMTALSSNANAIDFDPYSDQYKIMTIMSLGGESNSDMVLASKIYQEVLELTDESEEEFLKKFTSGLKYEVLKQELISSVTSEDADAEYLNYQYETKYGRTKYSKMIEKESYESRVRKSWTRITANL